MKRRSFIKNIAAGSAGAVTLAGIPVNVMAGHKAVKLAAAASDSDRVLIFVQLHGGNDGLNTLIPIHQYADYVYQRPNIAIPAEGPRKYLNIDDSIALEEQVGLHPDMEDFRILYNEGKAAVVKNVGYPQMNMSHFHGRDIMYMGVDGTDDESGISSGWMGRWLDTEYPDYPDAYPTDTMEDPIAIEMGNAMSIAYHRDDGIPIGLNVHNPEAFFDLINGVGIDGGQFYRPEGYAGRELEYLWEFEKMSNVYAEKLLQRYQDGSNSNVDYPELYPYLAPTNFLKNPLSGQLRLIARLLKGGIKTRIFLCRIGGFDTHAGQVNSEHKTEGAHAALLYHLSSSIKAFQDDLANLELEDRVTTMTFSEFGRRATSNESFGTDHGTTMPVFIFGKGVNGGLYGNNPDLSNLQNGNMVFDPNNNGTDYRQIYGSVIQDWFGASQAGLEATGFDQWSTQRLSIFKDPLLEPSWDEARKSIVCFPNPASDQVSIKFYNPAQAKVGITIMNSLGQIVASKSSESLLQGSQQIKMNISSLEPGNYIFQISGKSIIGSGKFVKY